MSHPSPPPGHREEILRCTVHTTSTDFLDIHKERYSFQLFTVKLCNDVLYQYNYHQHSNRLTFDHSKNFVFTNQYFPSATADYVVVFGLGESSQGIYL